MRTAESDAGEDILYFPVKVAIQRIGGVTATARRLGVPVGTVQGWCYRRRVIGQAQRRALAQISGVSLHSFDRYFSRLDMHRWMSKKDRYNGLRILKALGAARA